MLNLRGLSLLIVAIAACPACSFASIYNFNITYDGTAQSLDVGSDPMNGTTLMPGDGFVLDFHTASSHYWEVLNGDWSSTIYAGLFVLPSGIRTGDSTADFLMNGALVAQDIDLGLVQSFIHMGAEGTTLPNGLLFDQLIVNYSLTSDTAGSATINGDFAFFSFTDDPSLAAYREATVPELASIAVWSVLGIVSLAFLKGQRHSLPLAQE